MIRLIFIAALLIGAAGCDSEGSQATATGGDEGSSAAATLDADAAGFTATIGGALEMRLEGTYAGAGAKFGRYHINMMSRGEGFSAVVAFHRDDTSTPAVGTYPLGERDGFRGTIELQALPEREFHISAGDLVITEANGKSLAGRFMLTALERTEEFTETPPEITVEGSFRAQSTD